ncbi:hypothetical protein DFQ28_010827 [Apophysomyces sp. BC1034]|nr:hypothetical protein DFQ30_010508 [Apophysomyces sp. BC1015]KAG0170370.1 hypothetical protein DFQ29_009313 [Apophysomyces sp. BC1021]KAG0184616.1 hypothetical protein DFQ28_010827 [Apophysomyces sp. BC1034]
MIDFKFTRNAGLNRARKPKPLTTEHYHPPPGTSLGSGVTTPLLLSPHEAITPRTPRTPQSSTHTRPFTTSLPYLPYYDSPIAPWEKPHNAIVPISPKSYHSYPGRFEDDDDDDDDVPLGVTGLVPFGATTLAEALIASKPCSLLSDHDEDDDEDLIPIALLHRSGELHSAAEKYKEKVMERLHMNGARDP